MSTAPIHSRLRSKNWWLVRFAGLAIYLSLAIHTHPASSFPWAHLRRLKKPRKPSYVFLLMFPAPARTDIQLGEYWGYRDTTVNHAAKIYTPLFSRSSLFVVSVPHGCAANVARTQAPIYNLYFLLSHFITFSMSSEWVWNAKRDISKTDPAPVPIIQAAWHL
ncbi:uncharacterized protein BT62DRAFT_1081496 [Guyanagaster necrorhizus]|uniref:Uncharacterized protein n=1 Tax=Guyanagaster necrorhizus TaxID=856835 RepID=A0A9P7VGB9_9AGAR|nr:uncharacterized protein BT62DRAFT_1081496 [Guyanagaster necrorhizus MCA 3950]KAG7439616.1 hypothetical protein BT62DRAFT_1081496 [Guyanagaster necrorhizus MCA 3950]